MRTSFTLTFFPQPSRYSSQGSQCCESCRQWEWMELWRNLQWSLHRNMLGHRCGSTASAPQPAEADRLRSRRAGSVTRFELFKTTTTNGAPGAWMFVNPFHNQSSVSETNGDSFGPPGRAIPNGAFAETNGGFATSIVEEQS